MTSPSWYEMEEHGATLELSVRPSAGRARFGPVLGGRLKVEVKAPPEKGKANKELVRVLAKALGVAKRDVAVVRGATARHKTVRVEGEVDRKALEALEQGA
jgi:hypothetical protein